MIPQMCEMKLSELKKLVAEYGKARLLELVKENYELHWLENNGLCRCLARSLAYLFESKKQECQIIDFWFTNENGETIPYYKAFREIFPQWCKEEAWQLTYTPVVAMSESDKRPTWYKVGYWWPPRERSVRMEYLDKMIDIYKNEGGVQ